jgi:hypothetical protein
MAETVSGELSPRSIRAAYTTYTGSQTAVVGDAATTVLMNSASAMNYTINQSVFTVGDRWQLNNIGAGQTTIVAGSGITFLGGSYKSARQGAVVWIEQVTTDTFIISGDVTT